MRPRRYNPASRRLSGLMSKSTDVEFHKSLMGADFALIEYYCAVIYDVDSAATEAHLGVNVVCRATRGNNQEANASRIIDVAFGNWNRRSASKGMGDIIDHDWNARRESFDIAFFSMNRNMRMSVVWRQRC